MPRSFFLSPERRWEWKDGTTVKSSGSLSGSSVLSCPYVGGVIAVEAYSVVRGDAFSKLVVKDIKFDSQPVILGEVETSTDPLNIISVGASKDANLVAVIVDGFDQMAVFAYGSFVFFDVHGLNINFLRERLFVDDTGVYAVCGSSDYPNAPFVFLGVPSGSDVTFEDMSGSVYDSDPTGWHFSSDSTLPDTSADMTLQHGSYAVCVSVTGAHAAQYLPDIAYPASFRTVGTGLRCQIGQLSVPSWYDPAATFTFDLSTEDVPPFFTQYNKTTETGWQSGLTKSSWPYVDWGA